MPGIWQPLANQPTFNASTMLLLTDGAVMCQENGGSNWWRLAPSDAGDYIQGNWTQLSSMPNSPLYYASAVLRDGRVFVAGGEYNNFVPDADLLAAQIYDPVTNAWTVLPTPSGWTNIGDAPCCVIPDGRVLLGNIRDTRTALFDPVSRTWAVAGSKDDLSSEETWTLLPDQTVLTVECTNHPKAEKYVCAADAWVPAGSTGVELVEAASIEIGPAILLPDGRTFAIGATAHTALYTMPSISNQPGSWTAGPDFPPQETNQVLGAKDAPACLLPNGKVLCVAGPVDGTSASYLPPTYFFEFDPDSSKMAVISNAPNGSLAPYVGRMLLLPTGQVIFSNGTPDVAVFTPDGSPQSCWKPRIVKCETNLVRGKSYPLFGTQLNGLSQAVTYGDDATMATNYPIVRLTLPGDAAIPRKVFYCRTFNHSTMGVATGQIVHSTNFEIAATVGVGNAELVVIANGVASEPLPVLIS